MSKHTPSQNSVLVAPDALRADVANAITVVAERARELETAGRTVFDGIIDAGFDDASSELRDRAARVRCGARYAASLALELEAAAGRMDAFAISRQLLELDNSVAHPARAHNPGPRRSRKR